MRNTNLQSINNSPSNLFYKRQIRCHLPQLRRKINISASMQKKEAVRKEQLKNPRRRKKRSIEFNVGDKLLVQCKKTKKWLFKGTVTERVKEDSYNIRFKKLNETNEKIYLRNRSMMKDPADDSDDEEGEDDSDTRSRGVNKMELRSSKKGCGAICGVNAPEKRDHRM